ncbi:MAG: hypothetical protein ACRDTE_19685 [Pseudonocardiaceae bacterium]
MAMSPRYEGKPNLALAALWWPAVLIAIVISVTAHTQARAAIAELATLTEAALDLHTRVLATTLGISGPDTTGPLTPDEGEKITTLLRKGR